jgi:transketolase
VLIYVDINGYQCDGKMTDVMNIEPLHKRLEAFGIRTFRISGHDIDELVRLGKMERDTERPTCILCDTNPHRCIEILQKRAPKYHYVRFGSFEEKQELAAAGGGEVAPPEKKEGNGLLSKVHAKNLVSWAKDKPEVVVLSADLTSSTEIDTFRDAYPQRFFSMGIAEQNMLSFAGGLAREGFVPFIHTFAVFIYRRAFDQIAMSVAYPNLPVKMFGFLPGIMTPGGATHQAIEDIAVMRSLPNMTILETGDATDVESVLDAAMSVNGPVYVRILRGEIPRLFDKSEPMVVGRSRKLSAGDDLVLVTSGICTEEALRATEALKASGIEISHFHVTTLKPFNDENILSAIEKSRYGVITMENHTVIGGLGTIIAEKMTELGIDKKLVRIGLRDTFVHGAGKEYLMKEYGLDAMALVKAIEEITGVSTGITESRLAAVRVTAVHSEAKAEAL